MITVILPVFIFALIGAVSPGPDNIITTISGASYDFRQTISHILGTAIAYTLIVLVSGIGLTLWLTVFPEINNTLQYMGSAFLLYLSYKIAAAVQMTEPLYLPIRPIQLIN